MVEQITRREFGEIGVGLAALLAGIGGGADAAFCQTPPSPIDTRRKPGKTLAPNTFSEFNHYPTNDLTIYGRSLAAVLIMDAELPSNNANLALSVTVHVGTRDATGPRSETSNFTFANTGPAIQNMLVTDILDNGTGIRNVAWISFNIADGVNNNWAQIYPVSGSVPGLFAAIGLGMKYYEHDGLPNYGVLYLFGRSTQGA